MSEIRSTSGPLVLVVSPEGFSDTDDNALREAFSGLRSLNQDRQLFLATKHLPLIAIASETGWQTLRTLKDLRFVLRGHPLLSQASRTLSPSLWRQGIRSKLQAVGVLSLPRLRIWLLFLGSFIIFFFVVWRILPSARIIIWPKMEVESFTTNVFLVASGSIVPSSSERVRVLPLYPLTVEVERTLTFDQVSKTFTGKNAQMTLTVQNDSDEPYSFRKGTRFTNQAGMQFRITTDVVIDPKTSIDVLAIADPLDQYGEVVGERGNVPKDIRWDIPGLSLPERRLVYARNSAPAQGGTTAYMNVLKAEDIDLARKKLEQDLIVVARQLSDEERITRNALSGSFLVELQYDDLTKIQYHDIDLPTSFIGKNVNSIPVRGGIKYTVLLYDDQKLMDLMIEEIRHRIPQGKLIVDSSLNRNNLHLHVIPPWDDDFAWVKITADFNYQQRFVLSPITPEGALFAREIRESVIGKTVQDALRVVRNLPEVARAEIRLWPPWSNSVPALPESIIVTEVTDDTNE